MSADADAVDVSPGRIQCWAQSTCGGCMVLCVFTLVLTGIKSPCLQMEPKRQVRVWIFEDWRLTIDSSKVIRRAKSRLVGFLRHATTPHPLRTPSAPSAYTVGPRRSPAGDGNTGSLTVRLFVCVFVSDVVNICDTNATCPESECRHLDHHLRIDLSMSL